MALRLSCWKSNTGQNWRFLISKSLPKSRCSTRFKPESITISYLCQWHAKSQSPPDWQVTICRWCRPMGCEAKHWLSSRIFANGPRQTGKVVCQMENKTKSRENKSHNILQVPICNKGRTFFTFIRQPFFILSSNKVLIYHINNRMTFTKHFEEILECCNQKLHLLRILVNKKRGRSPETILQIYKQCVRPIFEYGIVSTITVSETVITKIQRVQNSFIRIALHLPKYVSARLLHDASGLPYVKERLISVGQNHLARMHANPLVEHTINSAKTNIAWDKYKTPISIPKPPDWSTDTDYKMQENEVTSDNVQPLPWKW